MLTVRAAPREHLTWLTSRIRMADVPAGMRGIEVLVGDRIVGMGGFDHWAPNSCQMHVAMDTPAAYRPLLRSMFRYAFEQCGKGVVFALVSSDNARALKLDLHLGFREVVRLRDACEVGVDTVVLEMRREDCRWLSEVHHG